MSEWYLLVKFLHVTFVVVWVGGLVCITVMNAVLTRAAESDTLRVLSRQTELFGKAVLGPVAGLALLSGLGLMVLLHEGMTPWMGWGLVAWVASIAFGATLLRRANLALAGLAATPAPDAEPLARARRRLALLNAINLVLLLSVVWVMVSKPGG